MVLHGMADDVLQASSKQVGAGSTPPRGLAKLLQHRSIELVCVLGLQGFLQHQIAINTRVRHAHECVVICRNSGMDIESKRICSLIRTLAPTAVSARTLTKSTYVRKSNQGSAPTTTKESATATAASRAWLLPLPAGKAFSASVASTKNSALGAPCWDVAGKERGCILLLIPATLGSIVNLLTASATIRPT
jgi:hypothetical protein